MPKKVPYDQYCPVARTLDIVGDRWTLLIVRELFLGPLRYVDLVRALPGVSTDVLATRLRRLVDDDLVAHNDGMYGLASAGEALRGVLREALRWGGAWLDPSPPAERLEPRLAVEAIVLHAEADASRITQVIELRIDDLICHVVHGPAGATAGMGPAAAPDAVVTCQTAALYAVSLGWLSLDEAVSTGAVALTGSRRAASALLVDGGMPESMRQRLARPTAAL